MQATLISLLALSTGALASPVLGRNFTCLDAQEGFAWSMKGFEVDATETLTTPAHSFDNGEVVFSISNPGLTALQPITNCSGHSSQYPSYFYGNIVYECVDPASDTNTKTTFAFDAISNLLSINQTWTCPGAEDPVSFFAAGSVNLTVTAEETSYTNPDWTMGETYSNHSKVSKAVDGPIMAFQISAIA